MFTSTHGTELAPPVGPFGQSVRDAVKVARKAKDLTKRERQLLDDLSRSEERYRHTTLEQLCAILARVPDALLRESFSDGVRAAISGYGHRAPASLRDALVTEVAAQAAADPAQLAAALSDDPPLAAIDAALAATRRHMAAERDMESALASRRFELLHGVHA